MSKTKRPGLEWYVISDGHGKWIWMAHDPMNSDPIVATIGRASREEAKRRGEKFLGAYAGCDVRFVE